MLKYDLAHKEPLSRHTVYGVLEVMEYNLFLDHDIGVMEMAMDETHVFIFNVYLEEEFRGEGLFAEWLNSLDKVIVAFKPIAGAKAYWERVADEIYY